MVTVSRPIEVRAATPDEVPKVAAVLADAMMNDPVFTFLRPGRLRREARLRTMFAVEIERYVLANGGTVWTTSGYDGAVAELPPDGWEMPKSTTGTEAFKWMWAFGARFRRAIRVAACDGTATPTRASLLRANGRRAHRAAEEGRGNGADAADAGASRLGWATDVHRGQHRAQRGAVRASRLRAPGGFELPEGGPPVWPMRRPPARADAGP